MQGQLCLSVAIWLTILDYIYPCCITGSFMVVPIKVPPCCCDFGWGMNSGWPPRPGCGPLGPTPGQYPQRPPFGQGSFPQRPPYPSGGGGPFQPGPVFPQGQSFRPVQPGAQEETDAQGGFAPQHQPFGPEKGFSSFQPDSSQSPGQQQYQSYQQHQMPYARKRTNVKPPKISDSDGIPWNETVPTVRKPGKGDKMPTFLNQKGSRKPPGNQQLNVTSYINKPLYTFPFLPPGLEPLPNYLNSGKRAAAHVKDIGKNNSNKTAIQPKNVHILVGDAPTRRSHIFQVVVYTVKNVTLHPDCLRDGKYNLKYDIGLVQTNKKIRLSSSIGAAKLPTKASYHPHVKENWILAAYNPNANAPSTVMDLVSFVKVSNVEPNTCKQVLNSTFYNETYNYCTPYYHDGRTDNCWDDFGASLSVNNTVFGVLIHKVLCGKPGSAGSFVNVAQNSEWIRKTVKRLSNGTESV